jgi:uncharacterized protein YndB with AHSA1/START domain
MTKLEFVYATYIETSPEKLWQALTDGDFTERYWFGHRVASDWKEGAPYRFTNNGNPTVEGKVITFDPTRRLAYTWHNRKPEAAGEGISRVTFDLEPRGKVVKLTVTHDELGEDGKTLRDISGGWPMVIANLKTLLETGAALHLGVPDCAPRDHADAMERA